MIELAPRQLGVKPALTWSLDNLGPTLAQLLHRVLESQFPYS